MSYKDNELGKPYIILREYDVVEKKRREFVEKQINNNNRDATQRNAQVVKRCVFNLEIFDVSPGKKEETRCGCYYSIFTVFVARNR